MTTVAGIAIPSSSPLFLSVVGIHIMFGIACTIAGIVSMLSLKGPGQHPNFGTIYYWCLFGVFVTATGLSAVRWFDDCHLFILGALSFGAAYLGRRARREIWRRWPLLHVSGMGASYILLLTAFYVDNGANLPLWRELPHIAFWLLPSAIGLPIIVYVLRHHPLARNSN